MLPREPALSDIAAAVRQNTTDHPDLPVSEAIASQIDRAGDIGLFSSAWSGQDDDELSTKIQQHLGGLGPLQHALSMTRRWRKSGLTPPTEFLSHALGGVSALMCR